MKLWGQFDGKKNHPYEQYENSKLWLVIKRALDDLVENQDLIYQTREEYVIGYTVKSLIEADIIKTEK